MIIAVLSRKGGVGKTTLAMHFAGGMSADARTLLVDEDETRNATLWAQRGSMPFTVTGMQGLAREAREHTHIVVDSRGGMPKDDIKDLYGGADRVVVPVAAEFMTMETMLQTVAVLRDVDPQLKKLRVVMTMARPGRKLDEALAALRGLNAPLVSRTVRFSEAFRDASGGGQLVGAVRGNRLARECQEDVDAVLTEVRA